MIGLSASALTFVKLIEHFRLLLLAFPARDLFRAVFAIRLFVPILSRERLQGIVLHRESSFSWFSGWFISDYNYHVYVLIFLIKMD